MALNSDARQRSDEPSELKQALEAGEATAEDVDDFLATEEEYHDAVEVCRKLERKIRLLDIRGMNTDAQLRNKKLIELKARKQDILDALSPEQQDALQKRLDFDNLVDDERGKIAWAISKVSKDDWRGSPYGALRMMCTEAVRIGYAREATPDEVHAISVGDVNDTHVRVGKKGNGTYYVPVRSGSTMCRVLFDRLHKLRKECTAAAKRYRERQQ